MISFDKRNATFFINIISQVLTKISWVWLSFNVSELETKTFSQTSPKRPLLGGLVITAHMTSSVLLGGPFHSLEALAVLLWLEFLVSPIKELHCLQVRHWISGSLPKELACKAFLAHPQRQGKELHLTGIYQPGQG